MQGCSIAVVALLCVINSVEQQMGAIDEVHQLDPGRLAEHKPEHCRHPQLKHLSICQWYKHLLS